VPGEDSYEGGGFTEGPPAENQEGLSKLAEPFFGLGGEGLEPKGTGPKEDLLGEGGRPTCRIPSPEMMTLPLEEPKQLAETTPNFLVRLGGEGDGRREDMVEDVGPVRTDRALEPGEVLERPGDATGTRVAERRGLLRGCQRGGELADQRVQPDVGVFCMSPQKGIFHESDGRDGLELRLGQSWLTPDFQAFLGRAGCLPLHGLALSCSRVACLRRCTI
jgi:hypothetical protein